MAALAQHAVQTGTDLPSNYWSYARWWELCGYPAFAAMLAVFNRMVAKPALSFGGGWRSSVIVFHHFHNSRLATQNAIQENATLSNSELLTSTGRGLQPYLTP
jgi:Predicted integral membrane protein (DUF2269)